MFERQKDFVGQNLDLVGILDGQRAYVGPELVQVDLTNACNNNCIACWCNSPLLGEAGMSPEQKKETLPFDLVRRLLDDCAAMGTRGIYLAGGGEPFMHPNILEIIGHIKGLGLTCHVNTNFTLVGREGAEALVEMGVDHMIVSLWAATPETYARTHPNKDEGDFLGLLDNLAHLVTIKQAGPPHIQTYNVIFNLNFHEVEAMADLAASLGVEQVQFTVMDVIPGKTDQLLLDEAQRAELLDACGRLLNRLDEGGRIKGVYVNHFDDFQRRVANLGAGTGDYDAGYVDGMPCYVGWGFSRILADGSVNACLKAHRIPVGNIHQASFREIWNSQKQRRFRQKARKKDKSDPIFTLIGNDPQAKVGCHKSCDDLDRNIRLMHRIETLSQAEKLFLRAAGAWLRLGRKHL